MAELITIAAQQRDVSDQKAKALRRAGIIPGVIYGSDFESRSLQFGARELAAVYRRAGTSSLVSVQLEGEEALDAFFRDVQRDPVTGQILHVDFYHVVAGQAIHNTVPVLPQGEAPVIELGAIVAQVSEAIDLECLPRDMPPYVVADLTVLDAPGQHIVAGDLDLPDGVTLISDPEMELFQVNMPRAMLEEEEEELLEELEEGLELGEEGEEGEETEAGEAPEEE
jgi:large subunit ribosomal protein L25